MSIRIDEIGFGGMKLLQDTEAFCYGVDSVLAADMCRVKHSDRVLDLCCGNGAISMIVCAIYAPEHVTGIEILNDAADLAKQSARLNGLSEKTDFICGDAARIEEYVNAASFDAVVCNPPYFERGRGVSCDASVKDSARHESSAGLEDFFRAAAYALRTGGSFYLVHRPQRLADIMECARKTGLEPKQLRMVSPHEGDAPNLLLLKCVKGGGAELKVLPPLAVRNRDGNFTEEIDRIYRRK
ncbi:MAG: tRNA1(Val) (adenine(37)-N6)-methyltransferase [Firmicutes bacterium]|nr:tRNA1(Val) (adenine(37)-N6)-methyltransferase [Bacillota bacterium]